MLPYFQSPADIAQWLTHPSHSLVDAFQNKISNYSREMLLHDLEALTEIIKNFPFDTHTWSNPFLYAQCVYGLKGLSTTPELNKLVAALTDKIATCRLLITEEIVGLVLQGLHKMDFDSVEVMELQANLAKQINNSNFIFSNIGFKKCISSLENLNSGNKATFDLLDALAKKIILPEVQLSPDVISETLFQFKSLSCNHVAINNMLKALTQKIKNNVLKFSPHSLKQAFYGLQNMNADSSAVRELLMVLAPSIKTMPLKERYLGDICFGLQNMDVKNKEVQTILNNLTMRMRKKLYFNVQQLSQVFLGLQNMDINEKSVANFLRALEQNFSLKSGYSPEEYTNLVCSVLYGLQNSHGDNRLTARILHKFEKISDCSSDSQTLDRQPRDNSIQLSNPQENALVITLRIDGFLKRLPFLNYNENPLLWTQLLSSLIKIATNVPIHRLTFSQLSHFFPPEVLNSVTKTHKMTDYTLEDVKTLFIDQVRKTHLVNGILNLNGLDYLSATYLLEVLFKEKGNLLEIIFDHTSTCKASFNEKVTNLIKQHIKINNLLANWRSGAVQITINEKMTSIYPNNNPRASAANLSLTYPDFYESKAKIEKMLNNRHILKLFNEKLFTLIELQMTDSNNPIFKFDLANLAAIEYIKEKKINILESTLAQLKLISSLEILSLIKIFNYSDGYEILWNQSEPTIDKLILLCRTTFIQKLIEVKRLGSPFIIPLNELLETQLDFFYELDLHIKIELISEASQFPKLLIRSKLANIDTPPVALEMLTFKQLLLLGYFPANLDKIIALNQLTTSQLLKKLDIPLVKQLIFEKVSTLDNLKLMRFNYSFFNNLNPTDMRMKKRLLSMAHQLHLIQQMASLSENTLLETIGEVYCLLLCVPAEQLVIIEDGCIAFLDKLANSHSSKKFINVYDQILYYFINTTHVKVLKNRANFSTQFIEKLPLVLQLMFDLVASNIYKDKTLIRRVHGRVSDSAIFKQINNQRFLLNQLFQEPDFCSHNLLELFGYCKKSFEMQWIVLKVFKKIPSKDRNLRLKTIVSVFNQLELAEKKMLAMVFNKKRQEFIGNNHVHVDLVIEYMRSVIHAIENDNMTYTHLLTLILISPDFEKKEFNEVKATYSSNPFNLTKIYYEHITTLESLTKLLNATPLEMYENAFRNEAINRLIGDDRALGVLLAKLSIKQYLKAFIAYLIVNKTAVNSIESVAIILAQLQPSQTLDLLKQLFIFRPELIDNTAAMKQLISDKNLSLNYTIEVLEICPAHIDKNELLGVIVSKTSDSTLLEFFNIQVNPNIINPASLKSFNWHYYIRRALTEDNNPPELGTFTQIIINSFAAGIFPVFSFNDPNKKSFLEIDDNSLLLLIDFFKLSFIPEINRYLNSLLTELQKKLDRPSHGKNTNFRLLYTALIALEPGAFWGSTPEYITLLREKMADISIKIIGKVKHSSPNYFNYTIPFIKSIVSSWSEKNEAGNTSPIPPQPVYIESNNTYCFPLKKMANEAPSLSLSQVNSTYANFLALQPKGITFNPQCSYDFSLQSVPGLSEHLGVFTQQALKENTEIGDYHGVKLTSEEANDFTRDQSYFMECGDKVIDALQVRNFSAYFNSSPVPNIKAIPNQDGTKVIFITLREIAPGEQLLFDYGYESYFKWIGFKPFFLSSYDTHETYNQPLAYNQNVNIKKLINIINAISPSSIDDIAGISLIQTEKPDRPIVLYDKQGQKLASHKQSMITPFMIACFEGDFEVIQQMIKHDPRCLLRYSRLQAEPPLFMVLRGMADPGTKFNIVKYLIKSIDEYHPWFNKDVFNFAGYSENAGLTNIYWFLLKNKEVVPDTMTLFDKLMNLTFSSVYLNASLIDFPDDFYSENRIIDLCEQKIFSLKKHLELKEAFIASLRSANMDDVLPETMIEASTDLQIKGNKPKSSSLTTHIKYEYILMIIVKELQIITQKRDFAITTIAENLFTALAWTLEAYVSINFYQVIKPFLIELKKLCSFFIEKRVNDVFKKEYNKIIQLLEKKYKLTGFTTIKQTLNSLKFTTSELLITDQNIFRAQKRKREEDTDFSTAKRPKHS